MNSTKIHHVIEQTARRIMQHQRDDGGFSFFCEVEPLSNALMIILLYLIGEDDNIVISQLCSSLLRKQHEDGSWTGYPNESANLSITTLALFALRLGGVPTELPRMQFAARYVRQHGGLKATSNLTKIVLATAGELPWGMLPGSHIEFIFPGPSSPLSLFDFAPFARLHMPQYMILRHLEFHYDVPQSKGLADLLVPDTADANSTTKVGDLLSNWKPPIQVKVEFKAALRRCETFIKERMEPDGTLAGYLTSTALAIFAFQALGYTTSDPLIQKSVEGLKGLYYRRNNVIHQQLFTSTVWDTSLSMQALEASQLPFCERSLHRGASYLLSKQQFRVSDWRVHAPGVDPGGWGFSDINTLYPDNDDTIAALTALAPFQSRMESEWSKAVSYIVGMQNEDGGWSAFERNVNKDFLEHISINDMGQAMTDPSTADMTGRVLEALSSIDVTPFVRDRVQEGTQNVKALIDVAKQDAVNWLLKHQEKDGSWRGRWGITYIYGTWAALKGLCSAGIPTTHPSVQKAMRWIKGVQNEDGGFGESCDSEVSLHYVPLGFSTASQTSWALMAMMACSPEPTPEIETAVQYLLRNARPMGGWRERYPTGAGVQGLAYIRYQSYRYVWPLLALSEYVRQYGTK